MFECPPTDRNGGRNGGFGGSEVGSHEGSHGLLMVLTDG